MDNSESSRTMTTKKFEMQLELGAWLRRTMLAQGKASRGVPPHKALRVDLKKKEDGGIGKHASALKGPRTCSGLAACFKKLRFTRMPFVSCLAVGRVTKRPRPTNDTIKARDYRKLSHHHSNWGTL